MIIIFNDGAHDGILDAGPCINQCQVDSEEYSIKVSGNIYSLADAYNVHPVVFGREITKDFNSGVRGSSVIGGRIHRSVYRAFCQVQDLGHPLCAENVSTCNVTH